MEGWWVRKPVGRYIQISKQSLGIHKTKFITTRTKFIVWFLSTYPYFLTNTGDGGYIPGIQLSKNTVYHVMIVIATPHRRGMKTPSKVNSADQIHSGAASIELIADTTASSHSPENKTKIHNFEWRCNFRDVLFSKQQNISRIKYFMLILHLSVPYISVFPVTCNTIVSNIPLKELRQWRWTLHFTSSSKVKILNDDVAQC